MSSGGVQDWLRFLELDEFYESFIDNGYDDLETVKLIKKDDLEAIGVVSREQQDYLLDRFYSVPLLIAFKCFFSVRVLKEKGAAWVYLLFCDNRTDMEERFGSDTELFPR